MSIPSPSPPSTSPFFFLGFFGFGFSTGTVGGKSVKSTTSCSSGLSRGGIASGTGEGGEEPAKNVGGGWAIAGGNIKPLPLPLLSVWIKLSPWSDSSNSSTPLAFLSSFLGEENKEEGEEVGVRGSSKSVVGGFCNTSIGGWDVGTEGSDGGSWEGKSRKGMGMGRAGDGLVGCGVNSGFGAGAVRFAMGRGLGLGLTAVALVVGSEGLDFDFLDLFLAVEGLSASSSKSSSSSESLSSMISSPLNFEVLLSEAGFAR